MDVAVRFNQREIVIPFFRVGVPEFADGELVRLWEMFKDFGQGGKNDGE